ncbi:unnamed protein product [Vicia faba]|uniref:Uncharacterized protein n=1 Tax=Vicia faba TaxID=3906 RepID=A0AAV0YTR8_VICFA|nr:unnamed protein product [Vicia faba]
MSLEPQFNDGGFHDDVAFAIPPKPSLCSQQVSLLQQPAHKLFDKLSPRPRFSHTHTMFAKVDGFLPPSSPKLEMKLLQLGIALSICHIQQGSFIITKEDKKCRKHALNPSSDHCQNYVIAVFLQKVFHLLSQHV